MDGGSFSMFTQSYLPAFTTCLLGDSGLLRHCLFCLSITSVFSRFTMANTDRVIGLEEVKKHTNDKSCWLVIHGKVYDVTEFLEEHPGGYDIILTSTGKDATQDFEEIGHSNSAKALLEKYLIGKYEGGDSAPVVKEAPKVAATKQTSPLARAFSVLLPVLLLLIAIALNVFLGKK